jgi:hypothetical protein
LCVNKIQSQTVTLVFFLLCVFGGLCCTKKLDHETVAPQSFIGRLTYQLTNCLRDNMTKHYKSFSKIIVYDGDQVFGDSNNIEYRGTDKGTFTVNGDSNHIWSPQPYSADVLNVNGNSNAINLRVTDLTINGDANVMRGGGEEFFYHTITINGDANQVYVSVDILTISGDVNLMPVGHIHVKAEIRGDLNKVPKVESSKSSSTKSSKPASSATKPAVQTMQTGNATMTFHGPVGQVLTGANSHSVTVMNSGSMYNWHDEESSSSSSEEEPRKTFSSVKIEPGSTVRQVQNFNGATFTDCTFTPNDQMTQIFGNVTVHRNNGTINDVRPGTKVTVGQNNGTITGMQFGANSTMTIVNGDTHTVHVSSGQGPVAIGRGTYSSGGKRRRRREAEVEPEPVASSSAAAPLPSSNQQQAPFKFPKPANLQPSDDVVTTEKTKKSATCTLCFERERKMLYRPCNHVFACITCTYKHIETHLQTHPEKKTVPCPYCKEETTEVIAFIAC